VELLPPLQLGWHGHGNGTSTDLTIRSAVAHRHDVVGKGAQLNRLNASWLGEDGI
jgi:hypothetical protein